MPDLTRRLNGLTHAQLIQIIRRLVDREPSLADLVYLALPDEPVPFDPTPVATQVREILLTMGDDWRASQYAERQLDPLVDLGKPFFDRGAVAQAHLIWRTIALGILELYPRIRDEESEVAGVVNQCVALLGDCLDLTTDPAARQAILEDIASVYIWDSLEQGGYGMDEPASGILVDKGTRAERFKLAQRIRPLLGRASRWHRKYAGRLLLQLLHEALDDETRERILAEAGLDADLITIRLKHKDIAGAIALVRAADASDAPGLVDQLVREGHPAAAVEALRDHPGMLDPDATKLREKMEAHGLPLPPHLDELLGAIQRVHPRANIAAYTSLREAATASGQWPRAIQGLHPATFKNPAVRTRLAADRGEVEAALAALSELTDSTWRAAAAYVAQSLEAHDVPAAAALYRRLIIDLEGRGTKATATRVREIADRLTEIGG